MIYDMDSYFNYIYHFFDEEEDDEMFAFPKHVTVANLEFNLRDVFTSKTTIDMMNPDEYSKEPSKLPIRNTSEHQKDKELLQNLLNNLPKATIQKIPYNFGKTALGVEMMKLIKNGHYDDFIEKNLGKSKSFIQEFKKFCQKTCYETLRDFKEIWRYNTLIGYEFNDLRAVLTAVTKKFLVDDVGQWINKIKVKDYAVLYRKCIVVFLKGINDVESFDVSNYYA